jgi:hypothetical protein
LGDQLITKMTDMLFDPVKKISYRRLLAWSVGTALCFYGKIGDDAWMWVTIAFIAGEAAKGLAAPKSISKDD